LDAKLKLEMEIEKIKGKLQVIKHLGDDNDEAVQKKMEDMNGELQQKVDDLNYMEYMNHVLISKERESNDELQGARKKLIEVCFPLLYTCLSICMCLCIWVNMHPIESLV
jgi:hypothetical protein